MSTLDMLMQGAVRRDRVKAEMTAQALLFVLAMASLGCLVTAAFIYHPIAGFSAAGVAGLIMEARLTRRPGRQ